MSLRHGALYQKEGIELTIERRAALKASLLMDGIRLARLDEPGFTLVVFEDESEDDAPSYAWVAYTTEDERPTLPAPAVECTLMLTEHDNPALWAERKRIVQGLYGELEAR